MFDSMKLKKIERLVEIEKLIGRKKKNRVERKKAIKYEIEDLTGV